MDDLKLGRVVRMIRRRYGWRQIDLAEKAGVARWAVSMLERGRAMPLRLAAIRSICSTLEIAAPIAPSWRGVELPRLLDQRHASLVEQVVRRLTEAGWVVAVEYSFSRFGERGVVDVLAWLPFDRALLIVEVKSELDDLQDMLGKMDRYLRVVPALVAAERGWKVRVIGGLLVLPENSTSRWQVGRHRAIFATALPARNREVRRWIESPTARGPLRGLWFLQNAAGGSAIEGRGVGGGSRRVRLTQKAQIRRA